MSALSSLFSTLVGSVWNLKAAVVLSFILALIGVYKWKNRKIFNAPLPPGPAGHWLYGNSFPKSYQAREFTKWGETYGPLFSLRRGRELFIIICGYQASVDIMEKEGAALVDRPHSISAGEIMSGGMRILLVGQGERYRKLRKALQSQLNIKIVETYEPIQVRNARNVILDILANPDAHQIAARRYAASVIMSITYGKTTPTSYSDPEVQEVNKCLAFLGKAIRPGTYLIDSFPILRYVPGYLNELKKEHQVELTLFRGQLEGVRKKMERNEAQPCFSKYLLEKQAEYELSDDELAYLAGSMFGAGSDTSAAAISVVIMAAAIHPEAVRRVQQQIDLVVGRDRLPTFADMDELTEVWAFVQETYRWRPVSVGGFPHRATRDIYYNGYVVPEGATVIGNHWALGRDPTVFPDPESFIPTRWINKEGLLREDLKFFNFGFGRRVCPGQHVANRSVFINTATLFWSFNISQDPLHPIDPLAFVDVANAHPMPFKARFEPRMGVEKLREMLEMPLLF